MVTAVGTNGTTCGVDYWSGTSATEVTAVVRCRTAAGALTSSQFSLLYTTNRPV